MLSTTRNTASNLKLEAEKFRVEVDVESPTDDFKVFVSSNEAEDVAVSAQPSGPKYKVIILAR